MCVEFLQKVNHYIKNPINENQSMLARLALQSFRMHRFNQIFRITDFNINSIHVTNLSDDCTVWKTGTSSGFGFPRFRNKNACRAPFQFCATDDIYTPLVCQILKEMHLSGL